ncbi:GNAT family N-acetyltransferase [Streptomyces globosus]|uniref:GNAT family N-acetyltransferase n=1 Tax=Streptomyces globosus TaxID=68209 RepID=UPI0031E1FF87
MHPIPPVLPVGAMGAGDQPEFALRAGFLLRPWRETDTDAEALADSCRDPGIRHWNRPEDLTPAGAREKIARWGGRWRAEEAAVWAITPPSGERPVGLVGLADVDLAGGSAEFVYWLLPEGRGHGVMAAAVARVSRWALDDLGLHRLRITHSVANEASCRVALQAGFPLEGTLRSALLHADGRHDEHLHARIQGDPHPGAQPTVGAGRWPAAMSDTYEVVLAVDLRDDLSEAELTELRLHLGLGPRPEPAPAESYAAPGAEDDHRPLLGGSGPARSSGGALVSVLVRRDGPGSGGWALTSRQELHPDEFDDVGVLLSRLAARAVDRHRQADGAVALGWTRFHESDRPEPLVVRNGTVAWPT